MKTLTIPDIAREKGIPAWRVRYALESRRVEPAGRCGISRFWTDAQAAEIDRALAEVSGSGTGRPVTASVAQVDSPDVAA